MTPRATKVIATVGPATNNDAMVRIIKEKGVDFIRINMSHSSIEQLEDAIQRAKRIGIAFVIDTEGSQIRTGELEQNTLLLTENTEVRIWEDWSCAQLGNERNLALRPGSTIHQVQEGDLIHIDFDTLILRVSDISTAGQGYITARAITGGFVGKNKAVVIDPVLERRFDLPPLSDKDLRSLELGLRQGVSHVAVSFVRSGATIDEVQRITQGRMKIISKIECIDALENIDEIIAKSDYLLIDRGDLSKEIPIERIPFTQKLIIHKARRAGTPVFVATNLLETMVEKRRPTRAEVHDVINTIVDGAFGLTLAAETAIGKYPIECINMLYKLIQHAEGVLAGHAEVEREAPLITSMREANYLLKWNESTSLVPPHGGRLVNRVRSTALGSHEMAALPKIEIDLDRQMEVTQIGVGTYSPLQGFMGSRDLESVVHTMRLADGTVWPIPVVLDVAQNVADRLEIGQDVGLIDERGAVLAILHLGEKYSIDTDRAAKMIYGCTDRRHPGVDMLLRLNPVFLAGEIDLVQRRPSPTMQYELSPKQVRRLFEERGWATILGFHTRNVIHRGHEFIQQQALEREKCDGLFIHPVIGKKKPGDFNPDYIIKSYERMIERFYPANKVVLATFSTFSRYAGPREALFTAICRKNYGCSHFIVGRDHTGVGNYYAPEASQEIFDQFPDVGIKAVKFGEVFYSRVAQGYVHRPDAPAAVDSDRMTLSGTEARALFQRGDMPPDWFMRPEIAQVIADAIRNGEQVFVNGT